MRVFQYNTLNRAVGDRIPSWSPQSQTRTLPRPAARTTNQILRRRYRLRRPKIRRCPSSSHWLPLRRQIYLTLKDHAHRVRVGCIRVYHAYCHSWCDRVSRSEDPVVGLARNRGGRSTGTRTRTAGREYGEDGGFDLCYVGCYEE